MGPGNLVTEPDAARASRAGGAQRAAYSEPAGVNSRSKRPSRARPVHCVNGGNSDCTATDVGQGQGNLPSMWPPRKARLLVHPTDEALE